VVIDANNKFWPISHPFVFDEDHTLYGFACNSTLDMTPGRTKESVLLGYGDMFFEPEQVKLWFPEHSFDEVGGSGNGTEGVVDALSTATNTVQHEVLSSPSKLLMAHIPQNSEGTSTIELRRSVPYATFLNHGQAIAGVASSLPTEI
jgi:hypothetical protein